MAGWSHIRRAAHPATIALVVAAVVIGAVIAAVWVPSRGRAQGSGDGGSGAVVASDVRAIRHVVALGDSVTAGSSCDCTPFPELVASGLAGRLDHPVDAVNDGTDGLTASRLLAQVKESASVRGDLAQADLVIITIGANDLAAIEDDDLQDCAASCYRPKAVDSANEVGDVVDAVRAVNPDARVVVTNYWNVFEDGADVVTDKSQLAYNDDVTAAFNAALTPAVSRGATVVDLVAPFKGDGAVDPSTLLADDGEHPNAAGHQVIAEAILAGLGFGPAPKA